MLVSVPAVQMVPIVPNVLNGLNRLNVLNYLNECGVNPIDWTAKRRNLECRSSEFLSLIVL
jgi:hypothetical protein